MRNKWTSRGIHTYVVDVDAAIVGVVVAFDRDLLALAGPRSLAVQPAEHSIDFFSTPAATHSCHRRDEGGGGRKGVWLNEKSLITKPSSFTGSGPRAKNEMLRNWIVVHNVSPYRSCRTLTKCVCIKIQPKKNAILNNEWSETTENTANGRKKHWNRSWFSAHIVCKQWNVLLSWARQHTLREY